MTISWPGTLPDVVLRSGYKETLPDSSLKTQMDAGAAKLRRRLVAMPKMYTINFCLTSAQVGYLETFYETTTESGTLEFTMNDPRTAVSATFRFKTAPIIVTDGFNFNASFDVEKMP